jgi:hypothetical protein
MIDEGDCGAIGGMKIGRGNCSTRRKPAPGTTLSTTNPAWPDPGSNPAHHSGKPATDRLSYGAAWLFPHDLFFISKWNDSMHEQALEHNP